MLGSTAAATETTTAKTSIGKRVCLCLGCLRPTAGVPLVFTNQTFVISCLNFIFLAEGADFGAERTLLCIWTQKRPQTLFASWLVIVQTV